MGFRHVFRHAYDYNLSSDKLKNLREKVLLLYPGIDKDVKKFKKFLKEKFSK